MGAEQVRPLARCSGVVSLASLKQTHSIRTDTDVLETIFRTSATH